uniref:Nuclear pore complex protein Nup85 n=1 Tax=Panagrolaimus davidi TaxID=227884 RepID=A0A914PCD8_9BILA
MKSSVARRFNDTTSTITAAKPDFATQKWNAKVDSLWPWKEEILNEYREKVDASKFYPVSGPEQSPYGSNGATRLIIQMHSVFNKISEMAAENKITIEDAMTYAEMYRKAIRKTTEEICQQAHVSEEAFYADSLIVASTVWGLVESILIRPSNRSIVADLIEWANDTFGQANELLNEVEKQAAAAPRVEEKDFYWTSVISLILVGQFQSASKVLSLASDARHNMKLQRMMSLLQLFDYNDLHADPSGSKFIYAKKQVQKYKEAFADDEPLIFIANMLLGDISTFKKASESLSRQWFELLPAYILFSNPTATVDDLNDLTMELYNAIGINAQKSYNFLNKFIMSLMKMNWIEALHDLASVASLLWLSVHLFDLILKIDDSRLTEEIETIRDTVFITYAKEIFRTTTNSKLIPCAVTYAFATKEYKYDFVEPFLCLIAANDGPRNPDLIETLMKICQEYGLFQAFHEITLALSCM